LHEKLLAFKDLFRLGLRESGVVQLMVTRTAQDEVAMVDNGSPFFQSWCVHESIRWRGSEAAWE
jgi:hypothetical protein